MINRLMINICSTNLGASKSFYTKLFNFKVDYDSDWFVHLISEDKNLELGIIDVNNELVPKEFQDKPNGCYITLVLDELERIYKLAKAEDITIVQAPTDTFYGQRRLLLKDPDGMLIDVSSPIPN